MTTLEEEIESIIGYDVTVDANDPRAECVDCHMGTGDPIYKGDEWGGYCCRCRICGVHLDVTLIDMVARRQEESWEAFCKKVFDF
jgi:hypothetical protein